MTRPRCTTVLRRLLDGASITELVSWLRLTSIGMDWSACRDYIEHCIRRGLRGEVRVRRPRHRSARK